MIEILLFFFCFETALLTLIFLTHRAICLPEKKVCFCGTLEAQGVGREPALLS